MGREIRVEGRGGRKGTKTTGVSYRLQEFVIALVRSRRG